MLDYRYIRDNLERILQNVRERGVDGNPSLVVSLFEERNKLITRKDKLREARNKNAQLIKNIKLPEERASLVEEGKRLKQSITEEEAQVHELENRLRAEALKIPNMAHPDCPRGKEEKDNLEIFRSAAPPAFPYKPKDHIELGTQLDIIDFETATKVSGSKFYFLKNQAVILELALCRFALDLLRENGFTITITPDIAKEEIVSGTGFNPRGSESNIYTIEGTDTCLIGTAEITLGGIHANSIINLDDGPILLAGLSHCFRREAGASGQYSKGLYRVHQFTKVEMFVYCNKADSDSLHMKLRAIEEEIFSQLEIPYRVVDCCTGDLGAPAYRKFDIEAWMPGRGENGHWGEVTSTSNCTDYQARRLAVRYRENSTIHYAHTLNGTAVAVSRAIIAILENGQQPDGSVSIPKALRPYCGFDTIPLPQ